MTIEDIQQDINRLTEQLRNEKPEVYRHLMENPKTFRESDSNFIEQLQGYRETLMHLLAKR